MKTTEKEKMALLFCKSSIKFDKVHCYELGMSEGSRLEKYISRSCYQPLLMSWKNSDSFSYFQPVKKYASYV